MRRIGIAASKMSKDSLFNYNLYVILISCLFSILVFLICGLVIFLIVLLVSLLLHAIKPDMQTSWVHMFKICLIILGVVVGIFNLVAIGKNIQCSKKHE